MSLFVQDIRTSAMNCIEALLTVWRRFCTSLPRNGILLLTVTTALSYCVGANQHACWVDMVLKMSVCHEKMFLEVWFQQSDIITVKSGSGFPICLFSWLSLV